LRRSAATAGSVALASEYCAVPAAPSELALRIVVEDPPAGVRMALQRGFAIPAFRHLQVDRHAASELIGLAQIELRVGVAGDRGLAPFVDCGLIVAAVPGIDPGLGVGHGRRADGDGRRDCRKGKRRSADQRSHVYSCPAQLHR